MVDGHWNEQGRQEHGWFGHGTADHSKIENSGSKEKPPVLPSSGLASTYSDKFVGHAIAGRNRGAQSGTYSHQGFAAALLGDHIGAVPFGTHLLLAYNGRGVVVEVDDVWTGAPQEDRVLDLSRAAMATLLGKSVGEITNRTAGVIRLSEISIVPKQVSVGS